ncbi:MAG: methylmalonyl Co-A mutase-associated GTPase MeaB [Ignavibacteriaceae bacterium]|nr:methylmalonyl Co-A mutase-associated GTPase MeaB [Ignavibacteriaceae bacterium]
MKDNFISNLQNKDHRSIARAISLIESDNENATDLLMKIHSSTGNAYRIGITGPPGAGKSTVTNQLTKFYRKQNKTIGIIAVDPTSPFTGGALLGDRVRMSDIGLDSGVFIRSMATRGSLGGLSKKAVDAADVLDAAGFDLIIFETVGVGQSELDIAQAADTTIVILVPESGDAVQAMKAGLMEIADFFILNKSDRPGSDQAYTALQTILMIKDHDENSWIPKIIKTVASENKNISDVAAEIENHKTFMKEKNLFSAKREKQARLRIKEIVEQKLKDKLWGETGENSLNSILNRVVLENLSPYKVADDIILEFKNRL